MSDFIALHLASVTPAASGISLFEFTPAPGQAALPPFSAGAHLALTLPSGLERQYSLCNDPAEAGRYLVAVKLEEAGRGGSREMHERLTPGMVVRARPPANFFPLAPAPARALLIAGGIGVTPIMAMAHQLRREGRAFQLVYLARSRIGAGFVKDLQRMVPPDALTLHFDEEATGFFDLDGLIAAQDQATHLHCCGPALLMQAVRRAASHWSEDRLHFEFFANTQEAHAEGDQPFTMVLARSGREIAVSASETPLEALLREGVDIDYSCAEGTCGTCITRLIAGEPDHRDAVLMPGEKATNFVLCCSRAKGDRLTLDL